MRKLAALAVGLLAAVAMTLGLATQAQAYRDTNWPCAGCIAPPTHR